MRLLKWLYFNQVFFMECVEVESCFWSAFWFVYTNKIEGEILQDNEQTDYEQWSRRLANRETAHVQNECSGDENIEMDV